MRKVGKVGGLGALVSPGYPTQERETHTKHTDSCLTHIDIVPLGHIMQEPDDRVSGLSSSHGAASGPHSPRKVAVCLQHTGLQSHCWLTPKGVQPPSPQDCRKSPTWLQSIQHTGHTAPCTCPCTCAVTLSSTCPGTQAHMGVQSGTEPSEPGTCTSPHEVASCPVPNMLMSTLALPRPHVVPTPAPPSLRLSPGC